MLHIRTRHRRKVSEDFICMYFVCNDYTTFGARIYLALSAYGREEDLSEWT